MNLDALLSLITAALAGSTMGSFLLLTLLHKPVLIQYLDLAQRLQVYSRFYRMNTLLCLTGGVTAALVKYPQASFILAILAVSYVFANLHIIRGLRIHGHNGTAQSRQLVTSLTLVQNLLHVGQFLAAAWVVYELN